MSRVGPGGGDSVGSDCAGPGADFGAFGGTGLDGFEAACTRALDKTVFGTGGMGTGTGGRALDDAVGGAAGGPGGAGTGADAGAFDVAGAGDAPDGVDPAGIAGRPSNVEDSRARTTSISSATTAVATAFTSRSSCSDVADEAGAVVSRKGSRRRGDVLRIGGFEVGDVRPLVCRTGRGETGRGAGGRRPNSASASASDRNCCGCSGCTGLRGSCSMSDDGSTYRGFGPRPAGAASSALMLN